MSFICNVCGAWWEFWRGLRAGVIDGFKSDPRAWRVASRLDAIAWAGLKITNALARRAGDAS